MVSVFKLLMMCLPCSPCKVHSQTLSLTASNAVNEPNPNPVYAQPTGLQGIGTRILLFIV